MIWRNLGLMAALLVLAAAQPAAAQPADTGRICAVTLAAGNPAHGFQDAPSRLAAVARTILAHHCQSGDVLELSRLDANPAAIVAQFCDLGRQIVLFKPTAIDMQVGISGELVCAYTGTRRTAR